MKKLLPFIIVVLIFAGCKKSNNTPADPNADNPSKILGKWKDGSALAIYYTNGKEVYRQTYPAPTTLMYYYEFTSSGAYNLYQSTNGTFSLAGTLNYSLTTSNTVLHVSSGSQSIDYPISFTDNNTIVLTDTIIGSSYTTTGGATVTVDKEVDYDNLVRL